MWLGLIFIQDIKSRLLNISVKHLLLVLVLAAAWEHLGAAAPFLCAVSPAPSRAGHRSSSASAGQEGCAHPCDVVPADLHQR